MKQLKIIVTVKQVPDTSEVKIDPETNTLMRQGIPSIVNPEDVYAIEAALRLRERHGGTVTALTMGPPQAEEALEEVIAMGVDRGILLSDRAFAGADTLITAFTLSRAVMKLGHYDLILCGRQAIDGDTAQVGPQLAAFLGIPQITYAEHIAFKRGRLTVTRCLEESSQVAAAALPCLVTVLAKGNAPRYPSLHRIAQACDESVLVRWNARDLKVPEAMLGLQASPTRVQSIFEPERTAKGEMLEGEPAEIVGTLLKRLRQRCLI